MRPGNRTHTVPYPTMKFSVSRLFYKVCSLLVINRYKIIKNYKHCKSPLMGGQYYNVFINYSGIIRLNDKPNKGVKTLK